MANVRTSSLTVGNGLVLDYPNNPLTLEIGQSGGGNGCHFRKLTSCRESQ